MKLIQIIIRYYHEHQLLPPQELVYMEYALTGLFNEFLKTIVFAIFFMLLGQLDLYLFICLVLLPIRWCSGGFHCKTFWGCFLFSFCWIMFLVFIPPYLLLPQWSILLLLLLIPGTLRHIPYTPPFRPIRTPYLIHRLRIFYVILMSFWIILFSLQLPSAHYATCGAYTLLTQIIQLYIPKKKEVK